MALVLVFRTILIAGYLPSMVHGSFATSLYLALPSSAFQEYFANVVTMKADLRHVSMGPYSDRRNTPDNVGLTAENLQAFKQLSAVELHFLTVQTESDNQFPQSHMMISVHDTLELVVKHSNVELIDVKFDYIRSVDGWTALAKLPEFIRQLELVHKRESSCPRHIQLLISIDDGSYPPSTSFGDTIQHLAPHLVDIKLSTSARVSGNQHDDESDDERNFCQAMANEAFFEVATKSNHRYEWDVPQTLQFPQLKSLKMPICCSGHDVYDYGDWSASKFPRLKTLDLRLTVGYCHSFSVIDGKAGISNALSQSWPALESLACSYPLGDSMTLTRMLQGVRNLRSLDISMSKLQSISDQSSTTDEVDESVIMLNMLSSQLPFISQLKFSGGGRKLDVTTSIGQQTNSRHFHYLNIVYLTNFSDISPAIVAFLSSLPRLTHLSFVSCGFKRSDEIVELINGNSIKTPAPVERFHLKTYTVAPPVDLVMAAVKLFKDTLHDVSLDRTLTKIKADLEELSPNIIVNTKFTI
ncbi:hypothetical protein GQ42DRAFT_176993 [Ramicandelaber brevisporus]|nr:hypothetical protein GQ42DRAFT_176993 [Ramicandelaber brevisporus]